MTNRLFISAEIPEEIKSKIKFLRNQIISPDNSIKWEEDSKLHITLKFLGDVEISKIREIEEKLRIIISDTNKISCYINKFGMFYRNNIPSILWIGITEKFILGKISENINTEFYSLGFPKEKKILRPHITIARLKGKEHQSEIDKLIEYKIPKINFEIEKINIVKSLLFRSGSKYEIIKSFKLN